MGNKADCCWDGGKGAPGHSSSKGSTKQSKKAGKNIQAAVQANGQTDETSLEQPHLSVAMINED